MALDPSERLPGKALSGFYRRLLEFARPYYGRLTLAFLAMLLYGAGGFGVISQLKPILDEVLPNEQNLIPTIAAVLGFYFAKGLGAYFSGYLMTDVGQRVVRDLRNRLFAHIMGQSAAYISTQTVGRLLSRLLNDVALVQRVVSETLGDLARESIALLFFIGLMLVYDPRLTLITLTSAPLVIYPLVRLGQSVRRTTRRSQEAMEQLSHVSAEALAGHRIVAAFGAEPRETTRFARASQHFYRTMMQVTRAVSVLPPLMEFFGGVAFALALYYGSQAIAAERLTTGEFVVFIGALFSMYQPAKKLSRVNADLQQARSAAERIFAVLDTHNEVTDRPGAAPMAPLVRSVEFRDARFNYPDAEAATLDGVSITVRAGQTLAIVGRSGAGKTTMVNLIPRFYDVTGGAVLLDGVDLRDVTLASLRRQVSIVTQETVLFDDTIAANIAYGRPDASHEQIEAAARAAHAHEFITQLEGGYEAQIGERGHRLSGGQRQRVTIARAFLRDAPILILDEATSSLDVEAELLVQDALASLMRNRTTFVIAHRLSTIRRADAIAVLDEGRIVEVGRHDELLARGGVYARLYELQLQEEGAEVAE